VGGCAGGCGGKGGVEVGCEQEGKVKDRRGGGCSKCRVCMSCVTDVLVCLPLR
jgi:hypothetical protein